MVKKIAFVTLFWESNKHTEDFSSQYTTEWVEKLYRGFARNTTHEFDFIVYTEKLRQYNEPIIQKLLLNDIPNFGDCIQPYELDVPMILVGLDTIVCGNIDHLIEYCFTADKIALPKAVYKDNTVCNGVGLVPGGMAHEYFEGFAEWDRKVKSKQPDMDWLRTKDYNVIDDLFPGDVVSYKRDIKDGEPGEAKIVFFHGFNKPNEISNKLVREHWK